MEQTSLLLNYDTRIIVCSVIFQVTTASYADQISPNKIHSIPSALVRPGSTS